MRNFKRQQPRKLPPKPKAERTWCEGGLRYLRDLTRRGDEAIRKKRHRFVFQLGQRWNRRDDERGEALKLQSRWRFRCPVCGRRLQPKIIFYGTIEPEFHGFQVPKHMYP